MPSIAAARATLPPEARRAATSAGSSTGSVGRGASRPVRAAGRRWRAPAHRVGALRAMRSGRCARAAASTRPPCSTSSRRTSSTSSRTLNGQSYDAQPLDDIALDGGRPPVAAARASRCENSGEHVLAALAQRRQAHGQPVEPRQQIGAKPPLARPPRSATAARRRRCARRSATGRVSPSGCTSRSSSTRSSFACSGSGRSETSSSSSVPPSALRKKPGLGAIGARERPPPVAEQLRLGEPLGERRAVDGQERTRAAAPAVERSAPRPPCRSPSRPRARSADRSARRGAAARARPAAPRPPAGRARSR